MRAQTLQKKVKTAPVAKVGLGLIQPAGLINLSGRAKKDETSQKPPPLQITAAKAQRQGGVAAPPKSKG
jgi:hypothetical protein